jgi:hypothetical protein
LISMLRWSPVEVAASLPPFGFVGLARTIGDAPIISRNLPMVESMVSFQDSPDE